MSDDLKLRLADAEARSRRGSAELAAGADDRARAIAEEVTRRGRGGAQQLAAELGVSEKTISQAVARARRAPDPAHSLPWDTLERLLGAELETLPPLPAVCWEVLAWIVRGTIIDAPWIGQPGELLAQEVEDADLPPEINPAELAGTCRSWTPGQAVAVIDACQRDDTAALPAI